MKSYLINQLQSAIRNRSSSIRDSQSAILNQMFRNPQSAIALVFGVMLAVRVVVGPVAVRPGTIDL